MDRIFKNGTYYKFMLDCNIIDFKLLPGGPLNCPALSGLNLSLLTSLTKLLSCPGAYKL
jgi:hypothetical protein